MLDLLEWIGSDPRAYSEVMEAWRTSCPRLPVWEEANARGFIARSHEQGHPGDGRVSRRRDATSWPRTVHAEPRYFAKAGDFRRWLAKNAATAPFLVVGFMKRGTGVPSMTWPQSVDEALCVGWIDGVRQRIDAERYKIRFSPRKPGSTWSTVNIARATALLGEGRLTTAGMAAFGRRIARKSGIYAYEQETEPELNLGGSAATGGEQGSPLLPGGAGTELP